MRLSWLRGHRGVAVALALGIGALVAVPALSSSPTTVLRARVAPVKDATAKETKKALATYDAVPRCDHEVTTSRPDSPGVSLDAAAGDKPIVQLVGNSLVVGITPCFDDLVEASGFALETASGSGQASCNFITRLREQVANPATRPDVAVWFSFDWFVGRPGNILHACNTDWKQAVEEALSIWRDAGIHVYLVPVLPRITPGTDPDVIQFPRGDGSTMDAPAQITEFRRWAALDPEHVTIVDAGLFLRDANGVYQWRMPCVSFFEPGCADGTVGVRWKDEFHFCADPSYTGFDCAPQFSGGDRRVAAAIAVQINELQVPGAPAFEIPSSNILNTTLGTG